MKCLPTGRLWPGNHCPSFEQILSSVELGGLCDNSRGREIVFKAKLVGWLNQGGGGGELFTMEILGMGRAQARPHLAVPHEDLLPQTLLGSFTAKAALPEFL